MEPTVEQVEYGARKHDGGRIPLLPSYRYRGEGGGQAMTGSRPFSLGRGSIAIFVLFMAVAAFLSWSADSSLGFGPDQIAYNLVANELLTAWQQGKPLKSEFGSVYRQSFALLHAAGWRLLGDAEASYRLILFLSACAYLSTMYILLGNVLQDRSIAAVTTVLSIVQRYTIGTSFWGMGEFQSILPRIVVLAVFPLAWLLFERHLRSKSVLQSFILVGLGFSLHLSALFFYCVLLLTCGLYSICHRSWSSLLTLALATICLFFLMSVVPSPVWSPLMEKVPILAIPAAVIGLGLVLFFSRLARGWTSGGVAIVYLGFCIVWLMGGSSFRGMLGVGRGGAENLGMRAVNQEGYSVNSTSTTDKVPSGPGKATDVPGALMSTRHDQATSVSSRGVPNTGGDSSDKPTSGRDTLRAVNRAIYARFGWTLFPISLATLGFALFNGGILGAIALYEFVHRWRREATERERIVGLFAISVVAVSLGLTGAVQLYSRLTGRPDIVLELFRAFRFIFLPLYIYLGLFLQRVWLEIRAQRNLRKRLLLGGLLVVLLLPPRQALARMPDSLKLLVRAAAERSHSLQQGDPSQQKYLYSLLATDAEREAARARHRDFIALCEWVRRSTPEESVFMTTDYAFIHYTGRDIMISYAQGAGSAHSLAIVKGYLGWHLAYLDISSAFASRSSERIMAAARRYKVDYVVTGADQLLAAPAVYTNESYRLYRIPGEPR